MAKKDSRRRWRNALLWAFAGFLLGFAVEVSADPISIASTFASLFISGAVTGGLSAAIAGAGNFFLASLAIEGLGYLAGKLRGDQRADAPGELTIAQRKAFAQQPYPPRSVGYGRFTIGPKIVASSSLEPGTTLTRTNGVQSITPTNGAMTLTAAITDHSFDYIHDVKINNESFLTADELNRLRTTGYVIIEGGVSGSDDVSDARANFNERAQRVVDNAERYARPAMLLYVANRTTNYNEARAALYAALDNDTARANLAIWNAPDNATMPNTEMKLTGMSWCTLVLARVPERLHNFWDSVPSLTLDVERFNSTLRLWPDADADSYTNANAALCLYDYVSKYTEYNRPVCGVDRIDVDSFIAAAAYCEEHGLRANGVAGLTGSPRNTIQQLCYALNMGVVVDDRGILSVRPGARTAPLQEFTADDVIDGSWTYTNTSNISDRPSYITASYVDEAGVQQTTIARRGDVEFDSGETIELDFINNQAQADQAARITLDRIWENPSITFTSHAVAKAPRPFDMITIVLPDLSIDDAFRVTGVRRLTDGNLEITATKEALDLYNRGDDNSYRPPNPPVAGSTGYLLTRGTNRLKTDGTNRLLIG